MNTDPCLVQLITVIDNMICWNLHHWSTNNLFTSRRAKFNANYMFVYTIVQYNDLFSVFDAMQELTDAICRRRFSGPMSPYDYAFCNEANAIINEIVSATNWYYEHSESPIPKVLEKLSLANFADVH